MRRHLITVKQFNLLGQRVSVTDVYIEQICTNKIAIEALNSLYINFETLTSLVLIYRVFLVEISELNYRKTFTLFSMHIITIKYIHSKEKFFRLLLKVKFFLFHKMKKMDDLLSCNIGWMVD